MNSNENVPLKTVLDSLNSAATRSFKEANPIPACVNHSQEFHLHEKERVFMREWICVGREDDVPEPGNYLTHEIADIPILVVKQKDKRIHAFVNACAHRFACLVPNKRGSAKRFVCRYHGWTYGNDGQLIAAPHMDMKEGFNVSDHKLRPLQCEIWQGFIYVTLTEKPTTFPNIALAPLTENVVGQYDMACYKTVIRESMIWNANWKNLIENFTESYHVPIAHGKTFAQHNKPLQDYICGEDSDYYGYHRAPQPHEHGLGAAHPNNTRLEGEWRRMMIDFCVFPCHLITLMPDYLWHITVQPLGTDKMQATWGVAIPPEVLDDIADKDYEKWVADFKNYMDIANDEDKTLIEALHIGSRSPILPKGTYHPIERNLWQFTRYLARVCA